MRRQFHIEQFISMLYKRCFFCFRTQKECILRTIETLMSKILIAADNSPDALRELYKFRKSQNSKMSLEWIAKKSGIPSKSNLSDVMAGRRKLNSKYIAALSAALGLKGIQVTFFGKLVERDSVRKADLREQIEAELKMLRKAIGIEVIESSAFIPPLGFYIFSALGLFSNKATLGDFKSYFRRRSLKEIEEVLGQLVEQGLIKKEGVFYVPAENQISFGGEHASESFLSFYDQSLEVAKSAVRKHWKSEQSLFNSTIISVKRDILAKEIKNFKEALYKAHSAFESSEANLLVQFNVQIYPVED